MSQNPLTFEELSREVAKKTGIGASETREVIRLINDAVVRQLKERGAVKIRLFGTFYVLNKKSHSITEIRSGKRRLLLDKKKVKFRSGWNLKAELARLPRLGKEQIPPPTEDKKQKVETIKIEHRRLQAPPAISFERVKLPRTIDPESIKAHLKQRLAKIKPVESIRPSGVPLHTSLDLHISPSGRFFSSLIKHLQSQGQNTISFTLSSGEKIEIYSGRPRTRQTTAPKNIVFDFLKSYLDLAELDIPQERFAKIKTSGKFKKELWLKVYTLPTSRGASVFLSFLSKREGTQ